MGCDIHAHIECHRHAGTTEWDWFAEVEIPRDYPLFSKLANVRTLVSKAEVPPRGFPADADYHTRERYEAMKCDAHSESWLTYSEFWIGYTILDKETEFNEARIYLRAALAAMTALENAGLEPRLVFWFDN